MSCPGQDIRRRPVKNDLRPFASLSRASYLSIEHYAVQGNKESNMPANTKHIQTIDRAGRRLRKTLDHQVLERLLAVLNSPGDDSPARLRQVSEMVCEIRKQDAAAEKNVVALLVAGDKTSNGRPERRDRRVVPFAQTGDAGSEGRRAFRRMLTRTIRDIYGLETPDEGPAADDSPVNPSPAPDASA